MKSSPFRCEEKAALGTLGIPSDVFKQGNLSLESDRYICIKEVAQDGTTYFNIVDIGQGFKVQKKAIKADSAIMHPTKSIISTRTGGDQGSCQVQVQVVLRSRSRISARRRCCGKWPFRTSRSSGAG